MTANQKKREIAVSMEAYAQKVFDAEAQEWALVCENAEQLRDELWKLRGRILDELPDVIRRNTAGIEGIEELLGLIDPQEMRMMLGLMLACAVRTWCEDFAFAAAGAIQTQ